MSFATVSFALFLSIARLTWSQTYDDLCVIAEQWFPNGLYSFEGEFVNDRKVYYRQSTPEDGYCADDVHLYWDSYWQEWTLGPYTDAGYTYYAYCSNQDPTQCDGAWSDYNGYLSRSQVVADACPEWDCDYINIPDAPDSDCRAFDVKLDDEGSNVSTPNVWYSTANDRYWYFSFFALEWVCAHDMTSVYGCHGYTIDMNTNHGDWFDLSNGQAKDIVFEDNDWVYNPVSVECGAITTTEYPTSSTPTVSSTVTNSSTHPQSALNATIQFADVLQPNTTLQVVAVVRVYALEMSNNITANCSEIVNVSSRTENARTVVILSTVTCSRSTQNELFAAFDASELETRIGSVTQSDVDITVMGADTGDEDPMPTEAQEEAEKPRSISWSLIAFGVVGFLLLVAVLWFVCRRFSAQWAKHKQDEDVALPQPQEQQHVARSSSDSSNIVAQPDEHKDDDEPRFAQLLREWGLAQFVRRFEAQGYTNVRVWTLGLTDDELKNMGLQSGHMRTFRLRCEELNAQMQRGLDHEQPGSVPYSQAEGKPVGALTGVDDGNLVNVELVNMNEEQVTAEGDDDDDDDEKEDVNEIVLEQQQQPQTLFMA